jgi:hypothetical protein
LVAATMKPRAKVAPVDKDGGRTVHRGSTWPAEVIVDRMEGFDGEVLLWMAARQSYQVQGIRGPEMAAPAGVARSHYPCFMPEWLDTARTSRMILVAVAKVPDPRGNLRWLMTPMDGRITMSLEGALLKVTHAPAEYSVVAGQPIDIPLKISRSAKLAEQATLEVVPGDDLLGLVTAQPIAVPPGQNDAVLRIATTANPSLTGRQIVTIRATAMQHGNLPVISETTVPIEFLGASP